MLEPYDNKTVGCFHSFTDDKKTKKYKNIYVIQLAFETQILSDLINNNNLAEDLIRNPIQIYRFKNNVVLVLSSSFNCTNWVYFENQKQQFYQV